jgi:hypothetical protein
VMLVDADDRLGALDKYFDSHGMIKG